MKISLLIMMLLGIFLMTDAAKPIDVEFEQITYRLDFEDNTAKVINAESSIEIATIRKDINYQDKTFIVESIGEGAFRNCWYLEKVYIPETVCNFEQDCFQLCVSLKKVFVSNLTKWCDSNFFWAQANPLEGASLYLNGTLVENLVIPEGVERLNSYTFKGCESIKTIDSPTTLNYIGKQAFIACPNLSMVNLNINIKHIDSESFANCPELSIVNSYSLNPPKIDNYMKVSPFDGSCPEYMTLHVPEGTIELYEKCEGWKDFGTIIDDLPNDSGVDEVTIDESKAIEIFNLNGVLVFSGIGDYKLPSGIYIIRQGWKSKKIVIK